MIEMHIGKLKARRMGFVCDGKVHPFDNEFQVRYVEKRLETKVLEPGMVLSTPSWIRETIMITLWNKPTFVWSDCDHVAVGKVDNALVIQSLYLIQDVLDINKVNEYDGAMYLIIPVAMIALTSGEVRYVHLHEITKYYIETRAVPRKKQ